MWVSVYGVVLSVCVAGPPIDLVAQPNQLSTAPSLRQDVGQIDDPTQDGWATEAVAQQILEQLNRLLAPGADKGPIAAEILAHDFRFAELRPQATQVVFRDPTLVVRRYQTASIPAKPVLLSGIFLDAWHRSLPADCAPSSLHVKCKVIAVTPTANGCRTRVRVERDGHRPSGPINQTSHWDLEWVRAGTSWQLTQLIVNDFEEAERQGQTIYAERTATVLGSEPVWQQQLAVGQPEWMRRLDTGVTLQQFGHHGLAVGDVNGDGWEDLYLCQPAGLPNRLLIHQPDGTAQDISAWAGTDWLEPSMSALLVDVDNDGDADLVLAADQDILIQSNDGHGRFAPPQVVVRGHNFMTLSAADYDGDGDLDIYATAYYPSSAVPGRIAEPSPLHNAQNGGTNVLLRNDSQPDTIRFEDVTNEVGLSVGNTRWSFGAAWEDYDQDGDPDLVVANDFGRLNFYRNDRGQFRDVAAEVGLGHSAFGMSACWADCDRDGQMDLYIAGMFTAAGSRIVPQQLFLPRESGQRRDQFLAMTTGNALFRNLGGGKMEEISQAARAQMGRWAWASPFVDMNNDGWEDLLVTNGWLTNERPEDL